MLVSDQCGSINICNGYLLQSNMYSFYSLKTPGSPLVISHRGLSSIIPQNTVQSTILGLQYGDFSQLDVMLTLDLQMVVFHDNYLSRMTNVSQIPEFAFMKREGQDYKERMNDWWLSDFTLEQLKKLKLKQGQEPAKRPSLWNWHYQIPTLRQFLERILEYKKGNQKRMSGLMIELKEQEGFKPEQLVVPFVQLIKELRVGSKQESENSRLPVLVASFNEQIVSQTSKLTDLPLLQLIDQDQKYNLQDLSKICAAVGISQKTLKDTNFSFIKACHQKQLSVMYWTIRTDNEKIPFDCRSHDQVQMRLIREGVDALITQFPETTSTIIRMIKYIA